MSPADAGPRGAGNSVQFSLLGPVRAWRGPAELDLGPSQQRAILALLVARANQFVSVGDLIDLLWADDPPGSAVNTIHKYIGAIRRLLEPGLGARASGQWLTRHGGAYRFAADESVSDLIAFRRMVKDAWPAHGEDRAADALDAGHESSFRRRCRMFPAASQGLMAVSTGCVNGAHGCVNGGQGARMRRSMSSPNGRSPSIGAMIPASHIISAWLPAGG